MQQLGALYPRHQAGAIAHGRIECVNSSISVASRDEPDSQLCILLARQVGLVPSLRDGRTPTSLTGAISSPFGDGAVFSAAQNSREQRLLCPSSVLPMLTEMGRHDLNIQSGYPSRWQACSPP